MCREIWLGLLPCFVACFAGAQALYLAFLQVPKPWVDKFAFIDFEQRRMYAAMVAYMDGVVGQIADALKAREMWDSTLMLFTSDNGGAIYYPAGANNHPLKGGKYSDWEGGVRMNAFLAGGALPPAVRGTTTEALMHISDWYAITPHSCTSSACIESAEWTECCTDRAGIQPLLTLLA